MTTFYLIRHGKHEYDEVVEKGFKGHSFEFAPLSDLGILQADECGRDGRFKDADIIISSPYTRALQTAAIISCKTGIKLAVELDLRETDINKNHKLDNFDDYIASARASIKQDNPPENSGYEWETQEELNTRVVNVLKKYTKYKKVIVVCHGGVIYNLTYEQSIPNCSVHEYWLG